MPEAAVVIQNVLTKNRAEELGYDMWEHFVLPPFYDLLDLQTARKPRLVIGGRGCGKTMLLRYLSHQTIFSPSRPSVPREASLNIGLYWKADTQFANAMYKRGVPEDTWRAAFMHMAALIIGIEVLSSLKSIATCRTPLLDHSELVKLNFRRLRAFDQGLPVAPEELAACLEEKLWGLESWVNDVRKVQEPQFLPGPKFILRLIETVRSQVATLKETVYLVYLDEYENLCGYQQEIINTWLKHTEPPLIFIPATKRRAFENRQTTGPESLSDIHDFRQHDLEKYLIDDKDFSVFAAEILFHRLALGGVQGLPVNPADLRDPSKLEERKSSAYRKRVLASAERMFPGVSQHDLALGIFGDEALAKTLSNRIQSVLKRRGSRMPWRRFFRPSLPEASIISPALLCRRRVDPEKLAAEMDKAERGEQNQFTGSTGWIHNNFIGCLLQLYEPHFRACPVYSGFRAFCQLAQGNIRHFLELCHKATDIGLAKGGTVGAAVPVADQAEAARQASAALLGEIRSFGRRGNQLYTFVLRLGSLFALAHQRPSQSEPEQNHFSIKGASIQLTQDDLDFFREAVKWSVLFEQRVTKKKQAYLPETVEYVLNPIYAPYFHISYRKRRRLELEADDVICLMRGSYDAVSALLKRFSREWEVEPAEMAPTLFSHLEQGNER